MSNNNLLAENSTVTQDQPHLPDARKKSDVTYCSGIGMRGSEIARLMKLSKSELQDHYQEELNLGPAEANRQVCENLFNMAVSPRYPQVAMFWGKARCGFKTNPARSLAASFVTLEEPELDDSNDNHPRFDL